MKRALLLCVLFLASWASAQEIEAVKGKVIADPGEYDAYMAARHAIEPLKKVAAMEAFIKRYPESGMKIGALEETLSAYQQVGDQAKLEETADRLLKLKADQVDALAVATFIERGRAAQGDAKSAARMSAHAEAGLAALKAWSKPEEMKEREFARLRAPLAAIFNGAAGFAALEAKDYSKAHGYYLKAVANVPNNQQDIYQLGVASLEMKDPDPDGFWYIARAIALSKDNPDSVKNMTDYGRAKYRKYHGVEDGWNEILPLAADKTAPPADFDKTIQPAPPAADLAVLAVQQNDPSNLSFADWEFILSYRDASSKNKRAALWVWEVIRDKEQRGKARLMIPVKVISATKKTIEAAITPDNQRDNLVDLRVKMANLMDNPPSPGENVSIIGEITDYKTKPFVFIMKHGELGQLPNPP